jgi:hypothetical protein
MLEQSRGYFIIQSVRTNVELNDCRYQYVSSDAFIHIYVCVCVCVCVCARTRVCVYISVL